MTTETSTETSTTETEAVNVATAAPAEAVPAETPAVEETALGGKPASEEAPAAEAEAETAATVPEAYELTAPEGMTLDQAAIDLATPIFKDLGLSNEQAQTLMPVAAEFGQMIAKNIEAAQVEAQSVWRAGLLTDAKADPEIGGAKWDQSLIDAGKGFSRLGIGDDHPFRALLNESGLGNHVEMVRVFAKAGQMLSEDMEFSRGGGADTKRDAAEILYPNDARQGA